MEGSNTEHIDHGVDGIQFWSGDEKEVLQFGIGGYTFSRLSPYQSWEMHFPKAMKYWERYLDVVKPNHLLEEFLSDISTKLVFQKFKLNMRII